MKALSEGEEQFLLHCRAYKLPEPEREYAFCKDRKFRFDFAWLNRKIAVEIEGGIWSRGRHNRGLGFESDCVKYNLAAYHGWKVFRFTTDMVKRGDAIDFVISMIQS